MSRPLWYRLEGHDVVPIGDTDAYIASAARLQPIADRRVARSHVPPDTIVSTTFLGLDHNHFGQGPPLVFETMWFRGEDCDVLERYATWAEAEAGHRRWVAQLVQDETARRLLQEAGIAGP